jgi:hypothetical protein
LAAARAWFAQDEIVPDLTLTELSSNQFGNLGEYLAYKLGQDGYADVSSSYPFPANSQHPLNRLSGQFIDIVWIDFGEAPKDDWIALQEVKTTSVPSAGVVDGLADDYAKLFGPDMQLTLATRVGDIKRKLKQTVKRPDLATRLNRLVGTAPDSCTNVWLLPSAVHPDYARVPVRLAAMQDAIIAQGWAPDRVLTWEVAVPGLAAFLLALASGN